MADSKLKTGNFHGVDFPDFVEFSVYKDSAWAYIRIEEDRDMTAHTLGAIILKLAAMGFEWSSFTYDLGYYDSVDNKTLEFSLRTGSEIIKKIKR